VIRIVSIVIRGKSDGGDFVGGLNFAPGLQVISGPNGFGKTLAAESIAWCLNLETMFGRKESDPTFFPEAVLEELNLPEATGVRVQSSEAELTLERHDGEQLRLTRAITHDRDKVRIERIAVAGGSSTLTLVTGSGSMADPTIGFQRYLFEWLGWPAKPATTFEGRDAFVYIENLAPLFYIEQQEGWTDIQARQIGRYAQQQIRELSVEYLLGALDAVDQRVARQRTTTRENALRASARLLADQVSQTFLKQGWAVDWAGGGSLKEIEARWSALTLREALARDAEVDIKKLRNIAADRVVVLRRIVTTDPVDPSNLSAGSSVSQLVVDLKQRRHTLNAELRTLRGQHAESQHLYDSLLQRIQTATDVHRLKTTGVGRLAHLECPTCHRELDADAFQLNEQTGAEVEAHIEALKRDRALTRQTLNALDAVIRTTEAKISSVDAELHNAQRTLEDVTASVGPVREQIVRAAANLASQERVIEKLDESAAAIDELQASIDSWLQEARTARAQGGASSDIAERISVFSKALGQYLLALGHSAASDRGVADLRLDTGQYEPYLGHRRLRALEVIS
jgi:DNA repair exonuclease SbcCD ATPase subunit